MSDSEIITIGICGELAGIDSENAWYNFVKKNYPYLFPELCCRSKFNRKRRNLLQVTELIREKLYQFFNVVSHDYYIVDSFPLEVCRFGRANFCRSFRSDGANYGKCPSKKETYFGFKVHALVTLDGNETVVAETIKRVREMNYAPMFCNNEQALRYVIKFAYIICIDYYLKVQELPTGHGIADVVFIPKRDTSLPAMIVELKWNETADSAIEQIKERNCPVICTPHTIREVVLDKIVLEEIRRVTYPARTKTNEFAEYISQKDFFTEPQRNQCKIS